MPSIKYWLWLSAMTDVSIKARAALTEHYGDAETAWFAPAGEFRTVPGIRAEEAALLERRCLDRAEEALEACEREGIGILTLQDAAYPRRLKSIFAPPAVLYVKGSLPDVDSVPSIAVLGTRSASPYGLKMGRNIAYQIAKCGGIVISGLTEGIDSAAAKGCLLAGGRCIGVLGTAHGQESPLQRDVAASGALVSEYPPGTRFRRGFYRDRNRISSGLAHGAVIVEAPEKSGALLFAGDVLEQGRELYAVPGNADAANSRGSNSLLKQGAKPVTCGWDVMCDFEAIYPSAVIRPSGQSEAPQPPAEGPESAETPPARERAGEKGPEAAAEKEPEGKKSAAYTGLREQLAELDEEQLKIIGAIGGGEAHIDDIITASGLSTAKVLSQLTVLEIKGYVRRTAGRRVSLNIIVK